MWQRNQGHARDKTRKIGENTHALPIARNEMTTAKQHILIASRFDHVAVTELRKHADVDLHPHLTQEELEECIGEYDALIVDSETYVPDRTIEYGYRLQVIGVAGPELDNISVSAARAVGVEVINVPDPQTLESAEKTMGAVLTQAHSHGSKVLSGRTLGIIGFGGVGHQVALRARAFDMRVLVHQPRLTPELALTVGVELRDLQELLTESDFISVHLPESLETEKLIGVDELRLCRKSAVLINVGNHHALDLDAIKNSLENKCLASAVIRVEPDGTLPVMHDRLQTVPYTDPSRSEVRRDVALNLVGRLLELLRSQRRGNPLALRVVPVEQIIAHEHFDPERVADLADRLAQDTDLVNPPVVTKWQDKYVVLDGATRINAFTQLGYPHIVVQLVPHESEDLILHTWYHAVCGPEPQELLACLREISNVVLEEAPHDRLQYELDSGRALCSLITSDGNGFLARTVNETTDTLSPLKEIVGAYTEMGHVTRTLNTDLDTLRTEAPDLCALIIFPQFDLRDVLDAAITQTMLPAGITRFLIPGRVLHLNVSLNILRSNKSLTRKNAWLNKLLAEKLTHRNVRYYQEPVILLDE